MKPLEIARAFRQKVSKEINLEAKGLDRFVVYTPFTFDDGDHYVVILKKDDGKWILTDEGNTFMRISYRDVDMSTGSRSAIVDQALAQARIENQDGELRLKIPDSQFGDALFTFVQVLARIDNTSLWTYERVKSTFIEDVRSLIHTSVPMDRVIVDYTDERIDTKGDYTVPYKIDGKRPGFVFPIANNEQCQQATIRLQWWERHTRFTAVALFEDQEKINRKYLSQLTSVANRQFPSLAERDRITKYFQEEILNNTN